MEQAPIPGAQSHVPSPYNYSIPPCACYAQCVTGIDMGVWMEQFRLIPLLSRVLQHLSQVCQVGHTIDRSIDILLCIPFTARICKTLVYKECVMNIKVQGLAIHTDYKFQ